MMQIRYIVSKIIETEKVPIYFKNSKTFSAVTYLKPNSNNQRGLYLPNCDSLEALEYCKSNTPDAFKRIKKIINTQCDFNDITFSVFSILHETGHWNQYIDFVDKGHTDMEFIIQFELKRINMLKQRDDERQTSRSDKDIINLNTKYDALYAELPTEKYANDFALNHLLKYAKIN